MAPSSSGGTTVGEALNIMERYDIGAMDDGDALHHYLEASALAFADRGRYVGDPAYVDVPQADLLSDDYAAERACRIDPDHAMAKPTAPGDVTSYDGTCDDAPAATTEPARDTENVETTNLTVADKWGNVVEYTLTIEQTGGSGIVVPGRGFLLNNELTDFTAKYDAADPNRIEPRQAAAQLDVPDDPAQGRQAGRSRSARRAGRPSSPRSCRCSSTASTAA